MTYKSVLDHLLTRSLALILLLLSPTVLSAQEADPAQPDGAEAAAEPEAATTDGAAVNLENGKSLFQNNCASCHARDMVTNLTGPALGGVEERWAAYPREDLYQWIRNSQAMIAEGHPRAEELWAEWKPTIMSNFTNLTDQEMEDLLAYIDEQWQLTLAGPTDAATGAVAVVAEETDNTPLFILLAVILTILAVVLARIVSNLSYMIQVREGTAPARRRTLVEMLTSRGVIAFVIFALVVLGGYTTVNRAIALGRQQGYQPEQPIKFSHKTHSGVHKIQCQYCHDGARRSKHSVIPALNTCMNCHRAIKVGSNYGTAELTKIYAAVGYDPSTDRYMENYEDYSREEIEAIYKKWITDTYIQENSGEATVAEDAEATFEDQWDGIVGSLTNEMTDDDKIAGPVEWVRIHNLPDHAYFNHAQHVTVGKLECQGCHGPIQEMEVVYQYSPLGMGWCINCHRQAAVDFEGNDYYNSYQIYHEQLQSGEREKVTVEDVGGLNCQKCHY